MSPRFGRSSLTITAACIGLLGCGDRANSGAASQTHAAASPQAEVAREVAEALADLEQDSIAASAVACAAGLDAIAQSSEAPVDTLELACELAVAGAPEPHRSELEQRLRSQVDNELTLELALEAAASGKPDALLELALQLEQRTGDPAEPFVAVDAHTFNAARAAAERAAKAGVADAGEVLERLEAREFPLAGVREEPLWRALYFRRYEEIQDTIVTRRHVAGLANALATLCQQWEPPGIRSVAFDAGLETYLAPVRAQVPYRLVGAVPKVADLVTGAVAQASEGAPQRSVAGWLEHGIRAYQQVKRDVQGALAVGSVVGRDAAQTAFERGPGCRSLRGLKLIESMNRYFEYAKASRPIDAPGAQRRDPGKESRGGSTEDQR